MDRTRLEGYFKDPETVDIAEMHTKFNFTCSLKPSVSDKKTLLARADFIQEELDELKRNIENGDYLETIDALVDIAVVVKGTAVIMGIRWKYHWDEVHRANMMKQVGNNDKRPDLEQDLIKPEGWCGPDHLLIMDRHGRKG